MENFIYRFRPLDRLLGRAGSPGELESLQIYFPTPAQLNDPLEGFKDYFWSGDEIVWRNLLRHYLLCLTQHCLLHLLTGKDEKPHSEILIENHLSDIPPVMAEIVKTISHSFLEIDQIKKYVSLLPKENRKFRRNELCIHFRIIHRTALNIIFSVFAKQNLCAPELAAHYLKDTNHVILDALVEVLNSKTDTEAANGLFNGLNSVYEQSKILHYKEEWPKREFFLLSELPEEFTKALESLTHPEWYTACFMSDCSNSSIWGTYGQNHAGICLKYKIGDLNSAQHMDLYGPIGWDKDGLFKGKMKLPFYKIDYERAFTEIDFFRSLGNLPKPKILNYWYGEESGLKSECFKILESDNWRQEYWDSFIQSITVKLKDWQFENEYRLIMSPSIIDLRDKDSRVLNYSLELLDGVIFGINTSTEVKCEVISILEKLCTRHNQGTVKVYQARYDATTKMIKHDELKLLPISTNHSIDELRLVVDSTLGGG